MLNYNNKMTSLQILLSPKSNNNNKKNNNTHLLSISYHHQLKFTITITQ